MKITATNYEAQKNMIDWAKVPKTVKDLKADMEFSLPFYNDDKDIKETIDLWLSHINKYVKKTPAKKTAPAPKKEPAKKQSAKKTASNTEKDNLTKLKKDFNKLVNKALSIKDISDPKKESELAYLFEDIKQHPIGIYEPTKNEKLYKDGVKKVGDHINKLLKKSTAKKQAKTTKTINIISKDKRSLTLKRKKGISFKGMTITEMVNQWKRPVIFISKEAYDKIYKFTSNPETDWVEDQNGNVYTFGQVDGQYALMPKNDNKTTKKTHKKTVSHKVDKQNVDHFSNEYMLLRRFYNLINTKKPINFRKLQLLFMAFEKAAVEKKVRKTSKVAGLYNKANAKLVKMYEIAKPNQEDIKVNITDKAFYNRLEKFVTGYQTDPAVRLLKRFINMQGTKPEKTSAKRLLTAITNAINKGKVSTKHRLYKELQEAKKELTSYLASPVKIKPHQQALNKPKKKNEIVIKTDDSLMSLADLNNTHNETFDIAGDIAKFLGNIERKAVGSVAVTTDAPQGAGKTTFAFQKIDAFARAGNKVLFVSLEEHPQSMIFKRKVKQYISPQASKNVFVLGELEHGFDTLKKYIPKFDAIFIDSWNKVEKEAKEKNGKRLDFDYDLRKAYNGKYFDVIFQRTQDGKMRGGSEAQFDGDVILKIVKKDKFKDNYAMYDKNRYMIDNYIWNIAEQKLIKTE